MSSIVHEHVQRAQVSAPRHTDDLQDSAAPNGCRRSYYRPQPGRRRAWRYTSPTSGGKSWQAPAAAGLDADPLTPTDAVWTSRKAWLHALTIEARYRANGHQSITISEGTTTAQVKVETLLDVAWEDAATADSRTGRHVRTSHATVAKRLGCSPTTVRRCRTLIETMGYARTVQRGRYLTNAEREAAYLARGRWQLRMASDRALVMPPTPTQQSEKGHLPHRGSFNPSVAFGDTHLARETREGRGSRRSRKTRNNKTGGDQPRYSLPIQRLAAYLVRRLPSLAPQKPTHETHRAGGHIGQVCRVLVHVGIDPDQWAAADIEDALNRHNRETRRDSLHRSQQRNPMGFLAHQLRAILAATPEGPEVARRRAAQAATARREAERTAKALAAAQAAHDRATGGISREHGAAKAIARRARLAGLEAERKAKHSPVILEPGPLALRHRG